MRDMPDYPCDDEGDLEYDDYSEDVNSLSGGDNDEDDFDSE